MNCCGKTIILRFGTLEKSASKFRIIVTHTVGAAWDMVCLKTNTRGENFHKTSCGITISDKENNIIQPQWFKGNYTLGNANILYLQPYTFNQDTVSETGTQGDIIYTLIKYLIEVLKNADNKEVVNDDFHSPIYDDAYEILEAMEGEEFEYVKYPDDIISLEKVAMVVFFLQLVGNMVLFSPSFTEMIER